MKLDYTKLTWHELADVILDVWNEMKRRNPIGINCYYGDLLRAHAAVKEIAEAEAVHPTSDYI